jgi:hypothetical protein
MPVPLPPIERQTRLQELREKQSEIDVVIA